MFQVNKVGTSYVPAAGEELIAAGHASGAGGRNYAFNFQGGAIPEPSVATLLLAVAGVLGIFARRRRR
ncbi:MAG: PEP-CTERM sorting domain-containing protein [Verrucomicrobia bacterium]|nr:PEP-CTERM sorting domain-containing protein [Verrucomicrobiota bacterium]